MIKKKKNISLFTVINTLFMILIMFVMMYPLYYIIIASFSDPGELARTDGFLWKPLKPFTIAAYKAVFGEKMILVGFKNTAIQMILGVSLNMIMTIIGAYFLALRGPMLQNVIAMMIVFTMYFSGGMVPAYLNVKDLGMLNTVWSLIVPGAIGTGNLIIMKSGFRAVPVSLMESAELDGASHWQILLKVMIPLSKATIAVLVLYYGVSHWNAWFNASIYLQKRDLYPLQLVARNILVMSQTGGLTGGVSADNMEEYVEMLKYALIVVSTAPILVLYPFLQKYFVKGVMVGSVKG